MGEYLSKRLPSGETEQVFKAGTCEDWRYLYHEEALAWAPHDAGRGTNLKVALKAPLFFRFPWPGVSIYADEVSQGFFPGDMHKRELGDGVRTVPLDEATASALLGEYLEHRALSLHAKRLGGGSGTNIFLPCPCSAAFATAGLAFATAGLKHSGVYPSLSIVAQKYKAGEAYTVFACDYCQAWFSMDANGVDKLKAAVLSRMMSATETDANRVWWGKVMDQIKANTTTPATPATA